MDNYQSRYYELFKVDLIGPNLLTSQQLVENLLHAALVQWL